MGKKTKKVIKANFKCLLISLLFFNSNLHARQFQAPIHTASWSLQKTKIECRLQQKIPHYGRAVFTNHALYGYGFYLQTKRGLVVNQKAVIRSVPSDWKHNKEVHEIADIEMKAGKIPLRLARNIAATMLAELEQGMFPTFSFIDSPGPEDVVTVALSAVKFRPAFKRFTACGKRLAKFKFKYIRNRTVYFETGKDRITPKFSRRLDEIAAYILRNQNVSFIRVDGHTDIVGGFGYNLNLSKKRAKAVRKYLVSRKVPASLIKTRHFGKLRPVVSNRSARGRSKNRRARIRLHKK